MMDFIEVIKINDLHQSHEDTKAIVFIHKITNITEYYDYNLKNTSIISFGGDDHVHVRESVNQIKEMIIGMTIENELLR